MTRHRLRAPSLPSTRGAMAPSGAAIMAPSLGATNIHDSNGVLRSIPACWTTVLPVDPFVVLAAERCLFRYEDLLKLADFVEKAR